jgi:hypothetical protein
MAKRSQRPNAVADDLGDRSASGRSLHRRSETTRCALPTSIELRSPPPKGSRDCVAALRLKGREHQRQLA